MAQLMLHRDVLKRFGKLPAKAQKKIYELTRKFEADSTQSSINLEQLTGLAKDPKVRSARVGDDYRAIVIAPEVGDIYLLVHVDHHDEAYAWCKNKRFEAHTSTGTLQIFDVEEAVEKASTLEHENYGNPDLTKEVYALDRLSDEEVFQAGVPEALIPAVRAVRNDDAFFELSDYLPTEAVQVLFGVVSGLSLDSALDELLGGIDQATRPESTGDFSHLATAANMDLVLVEGDEHLQEILDEDIEEWRIFLHPYQRKLVELKTKGPLKINGAAGTGKTVALMHRAVYLAGKLPANGEKVLVTTFTSNLAITIRALLEKLAPHLMSRIEVTHLHQLARTICNRVGWRGKIADDSDIIAAWDSVLESKPDCDFGRGFIASEYEDIIDPMGIDNEDSYLTVVRTGKSRISRKQRKVLWRLFIQFKQELSKRNLLTVEGTIHHARLAVDQHKFEGFRHVLVDELQDFGLESLRLIAALSPIAEELSDPLCVVGDGHQRIYSRIPIALGRAGINVRGRRSKRLKINYRTTEQIRQWAHGLLHGLEIDDLDGGLAEVVADQSIMSGGNPEVVKCEDWEQAGSALFTWISALKDNGIGSHEICITPPNKHFINLLKNEGVSTLELKARQADPGQEESGVRYGTKQRVKGLEFRAVALVIIDTDKEDQMEQQRNYVAATRAREHLLILVMGKELEA